MLISDDDYRLPLGSFKSQKLVAIADRTNIARIRKQQIHRPVFGFLSIIAKRPGNLEFYGPLTWDEQIECPFRLYRDAVSGKFIKKFGNPSDQLRFTVGSYAG